MSDHTESWWRCSFYTFGARSDPEYIVEPVHPRGGYDPHYVEVLYRTMKGIKVIAIVHGESEPTRERFEQIVRERVLMRLPEITEQEHQP